MLTLANAKTVLRDVLDNQYGGSVGFNLTRLARDATWINAAGERLWRADEDIAAAIARHRRGGQPQSRMADYMQQNRAVIDEMVDDPDIQAMMERNDA